MSQKRSGSPSSGYRMRQDFHAAIQLVEANAYSDIIEEGSSSFNSSSAAAVKLRLAQSERSLDPDSEQNVAKSLRASVASQTELAEDTSCPCGHVCACSGGQKAQLDNLDKCKGLRSPKPSTSDEGRKSRGKGKLLAPTVGLISTGSVAPNVGLMGAGTVAPNVGLIGAGAVAPNVGLLGAGSIEYQENPLLDLAPSDDDDGDSGNGSVADINLTDPQLKVGKTDGAKVMSKMRQLFGGTLFLHCQTPVTSVEEGIIASARHNRRYSLSDINYFEYSADTLAKLLAATAVDENRQADGEI